jgi:transposase
MIEWRNLKVLHQKQAVRITRLEQENKELRRENTELRAIIATQAAELQTLKLQMEELRTMVFGKKQKPKDDQDLPRLGVTPPQPRTPESYTRTLPKAEDITQRIHHPLDTCTKGHALTERSERIYYTHDIPAAVRPDIVEHTIEIGYCAVCRKNVSAVPLPTTTVIFGPHIQRFVAVCATVHRLSHPQIQTLLRLHYGTDVSDGAIAKMLSREASALRLEYEQLTESIRLSPIRNIDETGWYVALDDGRGRFGWVMSNALTKQRVYVLGTSRGKGNADALLGETDNTTVSDDYGAYRKLANHQLCFAHLARDLRDLAQSPSLPLSITSHCADLVRQCSDLYADIIKNQVPQHYERFATILTSLSAPFTDEPSKLVTLKTTLLRNIPKYLTCLHDARIPLTNNRAERDLRHLVLKRKVSFGSRNAKGADQMSVLMSCLLTRSAEGTLGGYLRGV